MTFEEFAKKKVVGVPVLYLAAAAVVILGIVAWRMKPTATDETAGVDPADGTAGTDDEANGLAGMDDPYGGFNTTGTVVVQPTAPSGNDATAAFESNDEWARAGAEWLVAQNKSTGTEASGALNKYLSGDNLTFDEGALVNAVIKEKGQPPDPITQIGSVGEQPARKQFAGSNGTHTVMGSNDNTYSKIAQLYYGSGDALHTNRVAEYNTAIGPATKTLEPGTKVVVASYVNPVYYKVTGKNKDTNFSVIAGKAGATTAMIRALNPTITEPIPVGTNVRTY